MKLTSGLCAVGLVCTAPAALASPNGITYDCDTAANHFSELVLPTVAGPFSVSGNVRLNALAASSTYVPLVRVQIASPASPGQESKVFAGFSLSALPVDPRKMKSGAQAIQMLNYNVNGKPDEGLPLSILAEPGTVQSFTLTYNENSVSVKLGSESKTFRLNTSEPVFRISCSTGEFLFTELKITPSS